MEQTQNVYVQQAPKIEYKTLFDEHVGQLDDEVTKHLNEGWMPHGPQYKANVYFYQPMIRVPQQMMPR